MLTHGSAHPFLRSRRTGGWATSVPGQPLTFSRAWPGTRHGACRTPACRPPQTTWSWWAPPPRASSRGTSSTTQWCTRRPTPRTPSMLSLTRSWRNTRSWWSVNSEETPVSGCRGYWGRLWPVLFHTLPAKPNLKPCDSTKCCVPPADFYLVSCSWKN